MGKRLYVGNLPFQTDDAALRDAFSQEGRKVVHVNIVIDRETGRPRGFAFVEMATEEEAKAALLKMDGADFGGRRLRVNEAEDRRPPRAGGPGGPPGGPRPDRPAGPRPPRTDAPPGPGDDRAPRTWPSSGGGGGGGGPGGGGGGSGPRPDDDRRGKSHERKGGRRRHDDEEDFGGKRGRRSSDYDDDEW